nr:MAG TPA: hypothetical protein [Caudoviricetes sp.]
MQVSTAFLVRKFIGGNTNGTIRVQYNASNQ